MEFSSSRSFSPDIPLVFAIKPRESEHLVPTFLELLYRSASFEQERTAYVIARGILCYLVAWINGTEKPQAIHIEHGTTGKPFIKLNQNTDPIWFNISYTNDLICIAVSKQCKIGIDVERRRSVRFPLDMSTYAFSSCESAWLAGLDKTHLDDAFIRMWTRKEAILKCFGGTVAQHMHTFTAPLSRHQGKWVLAFEDAFRASQPVSLMDFEYQCSYYGAVCWDGSYVAPAYYLMSSRSLNQLVARH